MGKKVKLSKEEKKRLKKEAAARRLQETLEAQRLAAEEELQRLQLEKQLRELQLQQEAEQRVQRRSQLTVSENRLHAQAEQVKQLQQIEYNEYQWQKYLSCDGLPEPMSRAQLNAFLHEITEQSQHESSSYQEVIDRCEVVLKVIDSVQTVLDKPLPVDCPGSLAQDLRDIIQQCERWQKQQLDLACYRLLTDVQPHIDLETNTVHFCHVTSHVSLALWVNCSKNLKNKGCLFKELGLRFELPKSLLDKDLAVRVLKTEFDQMSRLCASYHMPARARQKANERFVASILAEDELLEAELLAASAQQQQQQQEQDNSDPVEPHTPDFIVKTTQNTATTNASAKKSKQKKGKKSAKIAGAKSPVRDRKTRDIDTVAASTTTDNNDINNISDYQPQDIDEERQGMKLITEENELNLRQFRVVGGLWHLNLVQIPSQPVSVGHCTLRQVDEVQNLQEVMFLADYQAPPTISEPANQRRREPHEIEQEIRRQQAEMQKLASLSIDQLDIGQCLSSPATTATEANKGNVSGCHDNSMASLSVCDSACIPLSCSSSALPSLDHCVLLDIRLSDRVMWFDPPVFVWWNEQLSRWKTDGFHETRYNEDIYQIQTRCTRLGLIALAVNRFSNLPLQSWSLTPQHHSDNSNSNNSNNSGTIFTVAAAVATVSFLIQEDKVCLMDIVGATNNHLQSFCNQPMKPDRMIELLRNCGLDLFPDDDSHVYVEGSCRKHASCERHLYWCIAAAASGYHFTSSRWNLLAGGDNMVLQFREHCGPQQQGNLATLLVRPHKTSIIQCSEESSSFSDSDEADGIPFFADLLHLVERLGSSDALSRVTRSSPLFCHCVFTMLSAVKPLSYS